MQRNYASKIGGMVAEAHYLLLYGHTATEILHCLENDLDDLLISPCTSVRSSRFPLDQYPNEPLMKAELSSKCNIIEFRDLRSYCSKHNLPMWM